MYHLEGVMKPYEGAPLEAIIQCHIVEMAESKVAGEELIYRRGWGGLCALGCRGFSHM
jgi:hypothetical protein